MACIVPMSISFHQAAYFPCTTNEYQRINISYALRYEIFVHIWHVYWLTEGAVMCEHNMLWLVMRVKWVLNSMSIGFRWLPRFVQPLSLSAEWIQWFVAIIIILILSPWRLHRILIYGSTAHEHTHTQFHRAAKFGNGISYRILSNGSLLWLLIFSMI